MLEGKRPPGARVVVFDGEGYFVAAGLAELLAGEGLDVDLVTLARARRARLRTRRSRARCSAKHLHDVGIRQRAGSLLAEIHEGGVRGHDELGEPFELEADGVVLVTQRLSNDALYLELAADEDALRAEEIEALYRIGDCVAPRIIGRRDLRRAPAREGDRRGEARRSHCLRSASGSCSNGAGSRA